MISARYPSSTLTVRPRLTLSLDIEFASSAFTFYFPHSKALLQVAVDMKVVALVVIPNLLRLVAAQPHSKSQTHSTPLKRGWLNKERGTRIWASAC
jgi:hypothetical protein